MKNLIVILDRSVLARLKDEAASGVSYDSIDHASNPPATLAGGLVSAITSSNNTINKLLDSVHSISPSDVRAFGENVAKHCKEEHPLASVFFRPLYDGREQKEERRLVPSLGDQLESPYAPEPKIEMPGAFYLEPDIPEHNPTIQFEQLITRPLQNVRGLLQPNNPVVSVLDSVHNIDCDTVGNVIRDLAQAVNNLRAEGVNTKTVGTGIGSDRIVNTFAGMQTMNTHSAPISNNPSSSLSMARSVAFPFLNRKYGLPELVQLGVEISSVVGTFIGLPPLIPVTSMTLLQSPLKTIIRIFGPLFLALGLAMAVLVGIAMLAYKGLRRFI